MSLASMAHKVEKLVRDNSTTILTGIGVSGTITTAYLAGFASFKAARVLDGNEVKLSVYTDKRERLKQQTKLVWKLYIPSVASGALTIGCIIAGTKIGSKKAAAAYSLLSVSEKAFIEYKDKVVQQIGEGKEKAIRDQIAQDRVTNSPDQGVIVVGPGNVLCYEMHTGRYFNSDMETLRKAENQINAKLIREMDASLSDFYYIVRLPQTSYSGMSGWNSDKMLELQFSTTLSDDGRPCIAFDYNYIIPF